MKLCLGTVQLGMKYGISSSNINYNQALEILKYANKNGINVIDTAIAYGNAESIIGDFIENEVADELKVVTKLTHIDQVEDVNYQVEQSRYRLKLKKINCVMFHDSVDMYNYDILSAICDQREKGVVENIGVSVYSTEHAVYASQNSNIQYIQIPYNLFDQRLHKTEFFETVKKNQKTVFARSAFLQGLLISDSNKLPDYLKKAKPYLEAFEIITKKFCCSKYDAALQFVRANEHIDYLVFGIDNVEQLKIMIEKFYTISVNSELVNSLRSEFMQVEDEVILPYMWRNQ